MGYATRLFSNQLEKTEKHINASKVISINLMSGNYNYNNFDFINNYSFINKKNYGVIKDEYIELYLIRLDLLDEVRYTGTIKERFIRWIKLINAKDVSEMEKIAKGDEIMEETVAFVKSFLSSEERLEKYDKMNLLLHQAEKHGREEGYDEGKKEKSIETAKSMLSKKYSIKEIIDITGLSQKEIEALR